ncbi:serine hydrolase [Erythrobacter sp.]|uniref:serine hydrolase n=1 Tax=Erythrobacter sp. TaxID=1042 RepID=UPI001B21AA1F|nr:serine hydrolase [Erythrobacter sp.]MBO6526957.1 serine hydrolase [Erythrobacter sp.]MBO6528629.1 serine hydrolase [Erythrobacter sp.]
MIARIFLMLASLAWAFAAQAEPGSTSLLPTSHFAPLPSAIAPSGEATGTLEVSGGEAMLFSVHTNSFRLDRKALQLDVIPPLRIALVQHGARVLPVQRGPIRGTHPHWEWIVQPGAVWRSGNGQVRLSLPVALAERNANCVHNGLLMLQIGTGRSKADFQIASETCAYFQFDMRAQVEANFTPTDVEGATQVVASDRRERASRIPEQPIIDLPFAARLGAEDQVPAGALTVRGAVLGGVHYVGQCDTRAGPYPFCSEMVLPSYSWAKSLFAGIAAMRLEKLHPGSMRQSIATYVGGCEEAGWGDVTVGDALNMATGHYNDRRHEVDEASDLMSRFFLAEMHPEKILIACRGFGRRTDPGTRFVYRTADTYIAGTAITGILRTEGRDVRADIHHDLLQPIWDELKVSALMAAPRRTYDESAIPFAGWGLYLTRADLARIAAFLQRGGTIGGEVYLDPAMLSEAMQLGSPPHGLRAASDDQRYRHGFWAWNAGPFLGCASHLWLPLMSGYGGLAAAFLPDDQLYYHVSDGGTHRWGASARAIHEHQSLCEVSP